MYVAPFQPPAELSPRAINLAARLYLKTCAIPNPDWQAELIVGDILGLRRHELYLERDRKAGAGEVVRLRDALTRRARGEPTQYILGRTEFYGLPFRCDRRALIPRPETERLVELGLAFLSSRPDGRARVLDLGTGSGCIAVALAAHSPGVAVTATDVSLEALELARENARLNGVEARIRFLESDLFAGVEGTFELVLGNLPYVSDAEKERLPQEIREHEPAVALLAGPEGLNLLGRALADAGRFLAPAGLLLLEIGYDQSDRVMALARERSALRELKLHQDYQGHPRVLAARKL